VHGDANEMDRLKRALITRYKGRNIQILTPKNIQTVELQFKGEKIAKTMGSLAAQGPTAGRAVSGILVEKDFKHQLFAPEDLSSYTQLKTSTVLQRQKSMSCHCTIVLRLEACCHLTVNVCFAL
jgi:cleavage and polyadenylation specificity factor subunit 3